jgi:hypothetical protein
MSHLGKAVVKMGLLSLFSIMPLAAQITDGLRFTAPFSFYVGKTKMPPGSYTLSQPAALNLTMLLVRGIDGADSAAIGITPTWSVQSPRQSKVIFEKYGDDLYLNRVLLEGNSDGVKVLPTKTEIKAEENARVVEERSIAASGQ